MTWRRSAVSWRFGSVNADGGDVGAAPCASSVNRCQDLSPMPERDAKLFEIVIGQMREYRDIDVIFDKALGVLGHAEVLEPVRNLLHAGCPCGLSNVTGPFDFFDKELIRQIPSVVGGGKKWGAAHQWLASISPIRLDRLVDRSTTLGPVFESAEVVHLVP